MLPKTLDFKVFPNPKALKVVVSQSLNGNYVEKTFNCEMNAEDMWVANIENGMKKIENFIIEIENFFKSSKDNGQRKTTIYTIGGSNVQGVIQ